MIRPFVIFDSSWKSWIVVLSAADIDDKKILWMSFIKIGNNIFDGVAICFFDEIRSGKGHGYYSLCNISEIKLWTLECGCVLRTCNDLSHQTKHIILESKNKIGLKLWTYCHIFCMNQNTFCRSNHSFSLKR